MSNKVPDNLEREINRIISDVIEVEPEKVTSEARFIEDLGMDSIKTIELIVAIEERFGISIRDEEMPKITTLKQAVDLAKKIIEKRK